MNKELKIKCTSSDCDNNLHCFLSSKTLQKQGLPKGHCRSCKSALIDWGRIHRKDISDFSYTKAAFKLEMIRNQYWCIKQPSMKMIVKITSLSQDELRSKLRQRLQTTLRKASENPLYEGRQTPMTDNLIYWAQHATGTCCRRCLDEWHGIDPEAIISDSDCNYLVDIMMEYLKEKTSLQYDIE